MMNSAIVIVLAIAYSNEVLGYTIPTTLPHTTTPYTSPPPQAFAPGEMYPIRSGESCRVYECSIDRNGQPSAYAHTECYDSTIGKCVSDRTQIKDGCKRECKPYMLSQTGSVWDPPDCTTPSTPPPPPTTTPPPPPPPTTTPSGCDFGGVQVPYGPIPNSGDCLCDINSGYVICP